MFSLQRLLGKEDKFFDLLEGSARESRASVQALIRFVKNPDELKTLDEFILARRKEKKIYDEISEALCTTFVTALEREDIEALSVALYKVPKTMEKIGERILVGAELFQGVDLTRQISMLEKATDALVTMIEELRRGVKLQRIHELSEVLQVVESEGDNLILDELKVLYSGKYEGTKVVFLKDIFELIEKAFDRCRAAGNVINQIVLKNS